VVGAFAVLAASPTLLDHRREVAAAGRAGSLRAEPASIPALRDGAWRDRFGDGWPDAARLDRPADRETFARWLTYLAESAYYQPAPRAREEVNDCAALIRYAYRNALVAHTAAWRQSAGLRVEPGFGDVGKFAYPDWPLGRGLFRTHGGPFSPEDLQRGAFQEFADAQTMLRHNTFAVSKDLRAARPGDVLFYRQPEQTEPFHVMLFVGHSHFQRRGGNWIVYHSGNVNGQSGEVRHVQASVLAHHPEPRWRPLEANPRFLGVYRFNLLR
jgi:uncharacterized protein YfaT (DUF1175 family)